MARVFLAMSFCCMLGSCSSPFSQANSSNIVDPTQRIEPAREIAPQAALASLPATAGRVVQVRERRFWNGVYQEVSFAPDPENRGENGFDIAVETARPQGDRKYAVPLARPTEAGIRAELSARFPDMPVQIVTQRHLNAYGEFGLAIGRMNDGARCIYAWQWIDDLHLNGTVAMRAGDDVDPSLVSPASVRVRLCRIDKSIDELVAAVQKLHLSLPAQTAGRGGLDALIASSDDKILASTSAPMHVQPKLAMVKPQSKAKPKPKSKPHHLALAPKEPTAESLPSRSMASGAVLVPAPSYGKAGSYGARYLAPVDVRSDISQVPQTTGTIRVSPSAIGLPPQAFQGPNGLPRP